MPGEWSRSACPPWGGLFADDHCPRLDACAIANNRLLQAIHALAFFESGKALARVNYRDMGTEELGSVYESLLELHPTVSVTPWKFGFIGDDQEGNVQGSERKTSGSYYTPPVLVNELIKSALIPVIEQTLKDNPEHPREALLELNIVDPACGSGHFLLAAARHLAAEIARLDAGLDTPGEALRQHALRDIVQHCIYGVDKNPLAVELCKTALWIETVEPGKPLSFLDVHIRSGDSLVGILDPKVMVDGIPDEAYKQLTGDVKTVAAALRRRNQQAGQSVQGNLFNPEGLKPIAIASFNLDAMPEDTLDQIDAKRKAWQQSLENQAMRQEELKADLFIGAFFAPKIQENAEKVPLTEDLNRLAKGLHPRPGLGEAVRALAKHYGFFHWPLAFPEVFARGGFDVVLGNPPWERIKLQEQEFFASRSPEIATAPNKAARDRLIKALARQDATPVEKALLHEFEDAKHEAEAASQFIRTGGRYPLTGVGDINTYAIFAETFLQLLSPIGRAGLIVPTGIATDNSTKAFFEEVSTKRRLVSLFSFENEEFIFRSVHHAFRFCLLTLQGINGTAANAEFVFSARQPEALQVSERRFILSSEDIILINPNTKTCPVFRSNADAELTKKIYTRVPVLIDETKRTDGNPWGISFMRMFDMSNDSGLFRTSTQLEADGARRNNVPWIDTEGEVWVPLYEAKMIHLFDHRWATYEEHVEDTRDVTEDEKRNPNYEILPRYWVLQETVEKRLTDIGWDRLWFLGFRGITNTTNERSFIATIYPRLGVGNSLPLLITNKDVNPLNWAALSANLSALCLDFVARQKIGGTNLNFFYVKQFPILGPGCYSKDALKFIGSRVLELVYTSDALRPFAQDLGYNGPPFSWDSGQRALLRAEIDAYYAYLYGLSRDELRYILDPADVMRPQYPSETFRVLKENELAQFGEYRTRRLVLQAWDQLAAGDLR